MRQIEKYVYNAWTSGRACKIKNTETDGSRIWLHGHEIIKRDTNNDVWWNLCGWDTVTTRSRINALTDARLSSEHGNLVARVCATKCSFPWIDAMMSESGVLALTLGAELGETEKSVSYKVTGRKCFVLKRVTKDRRWGRELVTETPVLRVGPKCQRRYNWVDFFVSDAEWYCTNPAVFSDQMRQRLYDSLA